MTDHLLSTNNNIINKKNHLSKPAAFIIFSHLLVMNSTSEYKRVIKISEPLCIAVTILKKKYSKEITNRY